MVVKPQELTREVEGILVQHYIANPYTINGRCRYIISERWSHCTFPISLPSKAGKVSAAAAVTVVTASGVACVVGTSIDELQSTQKVLPPCCVFHCRVQV
jgi:hypothetical protein